MLQLQLPTHSGALGTSMRTAPQWHEPLSGMPQLSARYSRDEELRDVQPRDRFFQRLAVVAVLLDEVENLGSFAEIEASDLYADVPKEELQKQCDFYLREFKIKEGDFISVSYSDMLVALTE